MLVRAICLSNAFGGYSSISAFREDRLTLSQATRRCFSVPDPFAKFLQLGHMRCQVSNVRCFGLCSARSVLKCAAGLLFHLNVLVHKKSGGTYVYCLPTNKQKRPSHIRAKNGI